MSYTLIETSSTDGQPVELYEITFGDRAWRYTSADEPIYLAPNTYTPLSIYRSALRPAVQKEKADLTLVLPITTELVDVFRASPPSEVVEMTVYRQHRGDGTTMVIWVGRIINAKFDEFEAEFLCESIMTSLQRTLLTRTYQRGCPYVLYGTGCNLNRDDHEQLITVTGVSGATVSVTPGSLTADYFAGGYIDYLSPVTGIREQRFIMSNTTGVVVLDREPVGLSAGGDASLYPGCDHTMSTCDTKFSNTDNFGGQPFIPSKNPFTGSIVY